MMALDVHQWSDADHDELKNVIAWLEDKVKNLGFNPEGTKAGDCE